MIKNPMLSAYGKKGGSRKSEAKKHAARMREAKRRIQRCSRQNIITDEAERIVSAVVDGYSDTISEVTMLRIKLFASELAALRHVNR